MRCGPESSLCCLSVRRGEVGGGATTGRWSRRSVGVSGPGRRGETCRVISLPGRPSGGVSTAGPRTAPGTRCWSSCRVRLTRSRIWSGWSRSTPPWRGHTSTPPEHAPAPQGAGSNHRIPRPEPDDHALGRSRGGWSTKTHLSVDRRGRPLSVRLTPGQAGDNPQLLPLIDDIGVPAAGSGGRPRCRPDCVIADKAYSHPSARRALRRRGIRVVIPEKSDQIAHHAKRGSRGGSRPASTPACTGTATSSSAPSTDSKAGEGSPPAITSTPATTAPASERLGQRRWLLPHREVARLDRRGGSRGPSRYRVEMPAVAAISAGRPWRVSPTPTGVPLDSD
jgi:transposase